MRGTASHPGSPQHSSSGQCPVGCPSGPATSACWGGWRTRAAWSAGCPAGPGAAGSPAGQSPEGAPSACSCSSPLSPGASRCKSCPEKKEKKKVYISTCIRKPVKNTHFCCMKNHQKYMLLLNEETNKITHFCITEKTSKSTYFYWLLLYKTTSGWLGEKCVVCHFAWH